MALQLLRAAVADGPRGASIKHYILLDQGDVSRRFLDSAERRALPKPWYIARGRRTRSSRTLRQAAGTDPFKGSLSCDLLPYNRRALAGAGAGLEHRATGSRPRRPPALDAFTFDYAVRRARAAAAARRARRHGLARRTRPKPPRALARSGWRARVLSKNGIIKYQLIFRRPLPTHVERRLSASWLSQQATKRLGAAASFSALVRAARRCTSCRTRAYYMMFEVLEPNWHVLLQKLGAAGAPGRTPGSTMARAARAAPGARGRRPAPRAARLTCRARAAGFLDKCLKECMLRDAMLLSLLAKLRGCGGRSSPTCTAHAEVATVLGATTTAPRGLRGVTAHGAQGRAAVERLSPSGLKPRPTRRSCGKFDPGSTPSDFDNDQVETLGSSAESCGRSSGSAACTCAWWPRTSRCSRSSAPSGSCCPSTSASLCSASSAAARGRRARVVRELPRLRAALPFLRVHALADRRRGCAAPATAPPRLRRPSARTRHFRAVLAQLGTTSSEFSRSVPQFVPCRASGVGDGNLGHRARGCAARREQSVVSPHAPSGK